jgi:hypothetical protein
MVSHPRSQRIEPTPLSSRCATSLHPTRLCRPPDKLRQPQDPMSAHISASAPTAHFKLASPPRSVVPEQQTLDPPAASSTAGSAATLPRPQYGRDQPSACRRCPSCHSREPWSSSTKHSPSMGPPSRTSQRSASRSQYETRRCPVRTTRVPVLVVTMFAPLPRRMIRRCDLSRVMGTPRGPGYPVIRPSARIAVVYPAPRTGEYMELVGNRGCRDGAANGDNIGHRCRVTLVEIAVFGADAERAAEELGVTVGGDWPIGPTWRSRMPPRCCSSVSSSSRSSSPATSSGKRDSIGSMRRPERRRSTSPTTPTASPGGRPGAAGGRRRWATSDHCGVATPATAEHTNMGGSDGWAHRCSPPRGSHLGLPGRRPTGTGGATKRYGPAVAAVTSLQR